MSSPIDLASIAQRVAEMEKLAERIGELEKACDKIDTCDFASNEDWKAYFDVQNAAKSLAESFGLSVTYDNDDDDVFHADEAELDEAKSRLLRRDIPEALIHIERAAPDYLDGLPEAVAAFYARRS